MFAHRLLVLFLLLYALSGCARVAGGISPSTVPLVPGGYDKLGPVTGEHCTFYVLGLFPIGKEPSTAYATRHALEAEDRATALVDVSVTSQYAYWLLFGRSCITVTGTAVAEH